MALPGIRRIMMRVCVQIAWLGLVAVSLTACQSTLRYTNPEMVVSPVNWNEHLFKAEYFKNIRTVHQAAPDLCWAACLEQALALQGVDVDQNRLAEEVYPDKPDIEASRAISMMEWAQKIPILEEHLNDGSKVWVRCDLDGASVLSPITTSHSFSKRIYFELDHSRIPLLGISDAQGVNHFVTIVGVVLPGEAEKASFDSLEGFVVYDPLTTVLDLKSTEDLFHQFKVLVYVTTYDSAAGAITGVNNTAKSLIILD